MMTTQLCMHAVVNITDNKALSIATQCDCETERDNWATVRVVPHDFSRRRRPPPLHRAIYYQFIITENK